MVGEAVVDFKLQMRVGGAVAGLSAIGKGGVRSIPITALSKWQRRSGNKCAAHYGWPVA